MGNLKLIFLTTFFTLFAFASHADTIGNEVNVLKNPNFEAKTSNWTKTGASTFSIDAATPLEGLYSGVWDASATGEFLRSAAVSVPAGLQGRTCLVEFLYLWDTGTAGHILMEVNDGTNNIASVALDPTSGGVAKKGQLNFTCPTTGTMRFQLESTANATAIKIDRMFLGAGRNAAQLSQTELYAGIVYNNSTNCFNTTASATISELPDNANCTSRSSVGNAQYVNNRFKMRVPSLPKGRYEMQAMIPIYADTAGTACELYMVASAGSMPQGYLSITEGAAASNGRGSAISLAWDQLTDPGVTDFYFNWRRTSGTGTCYFATGAAGGATFSMSLKKYPLQSAEALTLETSGWRVDATIAGAILDLTTATVNSYTVPNNGSLTLTNAAGKNVIPAQITCSGGNVPTGTTCAAGNEQPGIAFNLPQAGDVKVCAQFAWNPNPNVGVHVDTVYILSETSTTSDTTISGANTSIQSAAQSPSAGGFNWVNAINICENFSFASAGTKVVKLKYIQTFSGGTPASSQILTDATFGNRNMRFTVEPLNQQMPAPVFTALQGVTKSSTPAQYFERATVNPTCTTATCTMTANTAGISSVTRIGTGNYVVNFVAGTFSAIPTCVVHTLFTGGFAGVASGNSGSTSSFPFLTANTSAGTAADEGFNIICMGTH